MPRLRPLLPGLLATLCALVSAVTVFADVPAPPSAAPVNAPITPAATVPITPPAAPAPSPTKIQRADYSLTPAVFFGDTFPAPRLSKPAEIEALLGPVTLTPRYFNAAQQEVTAPADPGRYGVVYEIKPLNGGPALTRCQTLYKLPQALDWRTQRLGFDTVSLPPELALDPAAVRNHQPDFNDLFNDAWRAQLAAAPDTAVVLASIADEASSRASSSSASSSSAAPLTARDNAWRRDQDWWYPLRKKLGLWTQYDHVVYTPDDYAADPSKRWPVLLFLHGSGDGETREALHKWGPPHQIAQGRKFPFILVAPRSPPGPTQWWYAPQLGELLDDIEKNYRVDKDRIYVTGLSMGGYGTWRLASEFPHRFAAIAPICGGWDETEAPRLAHLPVWAFHGDQDKSVPVEYTLTMIDALKKAGANPRLTIYPGVGHNCWEPAYSGQELYDWLLAQHRPALTVPETAPDTRSATPPPPAGTAR